MRKRRSAREVRRPARSAGHEHEEIAHRDVEGHRAIVAIHSTKLGPSLGGTRFYPFATEDDALADVLRLSKAMSYKSAAAGLDLGGGKAVIIGDPQRDKTEALWTAYGRFVDSLGGRYITTEDVGTTVADMEIVRTATPHVTGFAIEHGGSGDPSEATAWGVFSAMRTLARHLWGADTLEDRHVAIQGVGKVGSFLAAHLAGDGCRLTVADVNAPAVRNVADALGASVIDPDAVHAVECDIFSPCALGGALNRRTIDEMRCAAIAGCANNQLAESEDADRLVQARIVYAPDYIVNAGGVINISHEIGQTYVRDAAFAQTWKIGETLARVFDTAERRGITTAQAADHIAEERLMTD